MNSVAHVFWYAGVRVSLVYQKVKGLFRECIAVHLNGLAKLGSSFAMKEKGR